MKLKSYAIGLIAGVFLISSAYADQPASPGSSKDQASGQESSSATGDQSGAAGSEQKGDLGGSMQDQSTSMGSGQQSASDIQQIQQKLNDQGFNVGAVDGKLGPKTKEALRKFQEKQGIQASGQIDQQTMAALGVQGQGSNMGGTPPQGSTQPETGSQGGNQSGQQGGDMGGGGQGSGSQPSDPKGSDLGGQSSGGQSTDQPSSDGGSGQQGSSQQDSTMPGGAQ